MQGVRQKSTAGLLNSARPCTLFNDKIFFRKKMLEIGTTAIHGSSDTSRIFRSGMDAAGYIKSDVSAVPKLAAKSVQGCTLLAM